MIFDFSYSELILNTLRSCHLSAPALSFWKLLVSGTYGPYSYNWVQVFSEIFALHLLVLSGSQAQGLASFWKYFLLPLPETLRAGFFRILFSLNFWIWLDAISWPAPLTRAFFVLMLRVWMPRVSFVPLLFLGLMLSFLVISIKILKPNIPTGAK